MMEACERSLEVEELVLGRSADPTLPRHLATCADCQAAEAMFREELALFAARCAVTPKPPKKASFPVKRWAALALAAGFALAAGTRPVTTYVVPENVMMSVDHDGEELACMLPNEGEGPACRNVTFSSAMP